MESTLDEKPLINICQSHSLRFVYTRERLWKPSYAKLVIAYPCGLQPGLRIPCGYAKTSYGLCKIEKIILFRNIIFH
jgi:hypothetical protein